MAKVVRYKHAVSGGAGVRHGVGHGGGSVRGTGRALVAAGATLVQKVLGQVVANVKHGHGVNRTVRSAGRSALEAKDRIRARGAACGGVCMRRGRVVATARRFDHIGARARSSRVQAAALSASCLSEGGIAPFSGRVVARYGGGVAGLKVPKTRGSASYASQGA